MEQGDGSAPQGSSRGMAAEGKAQDNQGCLGWGAAKTNTSPPANTGTPVGSDQITM